MIVTSDGAVEPASTPEMALGGGSVAERAAPAGLLRALDLLLSLLLLPLVLPVIGLAGLLIKLDSPGPMIFRQTRIGRRGRPFTLLKLRSMVEDAGCEPHRAHVRRLLQPGAGTAEPWRRIEADPRVTRVGRSLRALCLDELPQLINVLRGDMSLVGPRPALPYEVAAWQGWHHARLAVRPGITGLWQAEGRDAVDFDGMVRLDLDYIRRRSLWLNLRILAKTPLAVWRRRAEG